MGGSLPGRDIGDYEYYCLVMFTLFKPWRKATDLNQDNNLWADAFESYKFSADEKHLMNNFNLIYECNDARDDYSAQQHRKNDNPISDEFLDQSFENPFYEDIDNPWNSEDHEDTPLEPFFDDDPFSPYYHKIKDMQQMAQKVIECGWIDSSQKLNPIDISKDWYVSSQNLSSADWKNLVQKTRKGLWSRQKTLLIHIFREKRLMKIEKEKF